MQRKKYIQLDAKTCVHEVEYTGRLAPEAPAGLMDVTARTDGPWLGKVYDEESDTFSAPPPEESG